MTYEYRNFIPCLADDFQDEDLTDIYFYKQGCVGIGVKARNPRKKEYGWKIKKIEVKLCTMEGDLQLWEKHKISCQFRLHTKHNHHLQAINEIIRKAMMDYFSKENTAEFILRDWMSKMLTDAYILRKYKQKRSHEEKGVLEIEPIFSEGKKQYFTTVCVESQSGIQLKQLSEGMADKNMSYPQLLETIRLKSRLQIPQE